MKAAEHRAFRELLVRVVAAAHNPDTAAQGIAAWTVLMKNCQLPPSPAQLTSPVLDRYADWFSERVDEEGPAHGLRCDVVVHQHFTAAEFALITPIVIVP